MEYLHPNYFFFALIGAVFWTLDYFKVLSKSQLILPQGLSTPQSSSFSILSLIRYLIWVIGFTGWLVLGYALMGPRIPQASAPNKIKVNDIFIVFDVSRSMLADDIPPNRLEVAKDKIREFAALRPSDRIGIIIFSEKVFTLLPLTTDPPLIAKIIEDINVGPLGAGTNIGDALGLAIGRAQVSNTKNKTIILLTDGVENVGNMTSLQAAKLAQDFNIKIYTIGLGTDSPTARIPIGAQNSQHYQSIPGGSIDTKTLMEIAQMTGGKYFPASDAEGLKDILVEINNLEKTEIDKNQQVLYEEKFFNFLLLAVFILFSIELIRRFALKEII